MEINVKNQSGFVAFVLSGALCAEELIKHINEYYAGHNVSRVLLDLSGCELHATTPDQFPDIAMAVRENLKYRGAEARSALYVPRRSDKLLISVFAARMEVVSELPVRVFEDRDKAIAWLLS
jgi:hypothetical protein